MITISVDLQQQIIDSLSDRKEILSKFVENKTNELYENGKTEKRSFLWFKWTKELSREEFMSLNWIEATVIDTSYNIMFMKELNDIVNILQYSISLNVENNLDDSQIISITKYNEIKKGIN